MPKPIIIVSRHAQCPSCNSYNVVCLVDHEKKLMSLACLLCNDMSMPYIVQEIVNASIDAKNKKWKKV